MKVGYARVSTNDQTAGLEAQLVELGKVGVEKVFSEQTSAVGHRKALDDALEFCREGDTLIVSKLDRLARSVSHLARVVETLQRKDVALRILNLNLDTATPTGKLMINLLACIAHHAGAAEGRNRGSKGSGEISRKSSNGQAKSRCRSKTPRRWAQCG